MRLKVSKDTILNSLESNIDYNIKNHITKGSYGYRELTELEYSVMKIAKSVAIESIRELLNSVYTEEEFERDLQLRD